MGPVNVPQVLRERAGPQETIRTPRREARGVAYSDASSRCQSQPGADNLAVPTTTSESPETPSATAVHDLVDCNTATVLTVTTHQTKLPSNIILKVAPEAVLADDTQAIRQAAPRMRAPEREVHATFFVAGDQGVGKTTFIHQLARSYNQGASEGKNAAREHNNTGNTSTMQQFIVEPEGLMSRLRPIEVPGERLSINLNLQDSPGVGDDIDHKSFLRIMVRHILKQQEADYKLLQGNIKHLGPAMAGCLQNSVTALLYFLPPHRVRKLDIITMAALGQLVPLIPVVGKADSMTPEEAIKYRKELLQALKDPEAFVSKRTSSKEPLQVKFFKFPDADLLGVGVVPGLESHAYLLVTSDTYQDGRPVRVYPFGAFDAANRQHSDFIVLKRLLMSDQNNGFWSLQHSALECYYSFCGRYEALGKDINNLVDSNCADWAPYLENGGYKCLAQSCKGLDQTKQEKKPCEKLQKVLPSLSKSVSLKVKSDKCAEQGPKSRGRMLACIPSSSIRAKLLLNKFKW